MNKDECDDESVKKVELMDDLIIEFMKVFQFDDGLDMIMHPCSMMLEIECLNFIANADHKSQCVATILWILQRIWHSQRITENLKDIQIAANMLAACQHNIIGLQKQDELPKRMMRIKLVGD